MSRRRPKMDWERERSRDRVRRSDLTPEMIASWDFDALARESRIPERGPSRDHLGIAQDAERYRGHGLWILDGIDPETGELLGDDDELGDFPDKWAWVCECGTAGVEDSDLVAAKRWRSHARATLPKITRAPRGSRRSSR